MAKKLSVFFTTLSLIACAQALASGPVLPYIGQDGPNPVCSGPICAQVDPTEYGGLFLRGTYLGYLAGEVKNGRRVTAGVVNNGKYLGDTDLYIAGRDSVAFTLVVSNLEDGDVALYLFDQHGHYDSDFGSNYHFDFQRK